MLRRSIRRRTSAPVRPAHPQLERTKSEPEEELAREVTVNAVQETEKVPESRMRLPFQGQGKEFLISLSLLTMGFLFLEGSLLFSFRTAQLLLTTPARVPLELPLRQNLRDSEIQGFLAFLTQLPEVHRLRFLTKEQKASLLQSEYPEHLPLLENSLPGSVLTDTVEFTVHSVRDFQTLLGTLLRPAPSSILAPSFLEAVAAWERDIARETSFWRTAEILAHVFSVASLLLLFLLFRNILSSMKKERAEEMRVKTLLGAAPSSLRLSLLSPLLLLSLPALFLSTLLLSGGVFLF